ncbi:G2/mitotic-specific cyclin-2-like [Pyrus ussuriensis x Pyrus communis]|uniref:G2/mitotic-specific cyclin-2-like n=1 Tax=Pyrus ussuriensis x Pyrus communis TaxID=2448454 RepID=A0A5N5G329_9ROSA|nr:G2/mitotic-specific cyclin-2-like [Pyrus ussuriensis x Pyrus communis]
MGSKENNPALVRPSNFQEFVWGQRLRDVQNITRKECPSLSFTNELIRDITIVVIQEGCCGMFAQLLQQQPKVVRGLYTRFAQLLQQQPKETKEVSVSSFAANPQLCRTLIRKLRDRSRMFYTAYYVRKHS